jgi:hypothetical protein
LEVKVLDYVIHDNTTEVELKDIPIGDWFELNKKPCRVLKHGPIGVLIEKECFPSSRMWRRDTDLLVTPLKLVKAVFERQ